VLCFLLHIPSLSRRDLEEYSASPPRPNSPPSCLSQPFRIHSRTLAMALLFLKSVVFPRMKASQSTSYSPIHNTPSDFARRPSTSHSHSSSSSTDLSRTTSSDLEKGFHHDFSDSDSRTSEKETTQGVNSIFTNRLISDATIGLSDGLTVPFALTAGLSALGSSRVVVYGGLAELIAGAISMGLGGYLGAQSEA